MVSSEDGKGVHSLGKGNKGSKNMVRMMTVVRSIRAIYRPLKQAELVPRRHLDLQAIGQLRPDNGIEERLNNPHRQLDNGNPAQRVHSLIHTSMLLLRNPGFGQNVQTKGFHGRAVRQGKSPGRVRHRKTPAGSSEGFRLINVENPVMGVLPGITVDPSMVDTLRLVTPQEAVIRESLKREPTRNIHSMDPRIHMQQRHKHRKDTTLEHAVGSLEGRRVQELT
eukprot:3959369-Amphidinium_carterae.1